MTPTDLRILADFIRDHAARHVDGRSLFQSLANHTHCEAITALDLALAALQLAVDLVAENEDLQAEVEEFEEQVDDDLEDIETASLSTPISRINV